MDITDFTTPAPSISKSASEYSLRHPYGGERSVFNHETHSTKLLVGSSLATSTPAPSLPSTPRPRSEDSPRPPNQVETEASSEANDGNYLTGTPLFALLIGLTMAAFLLMIDSTILVTAVPTITSAFNSLDDVGWYGSAYLLTTCALQLLFGKIYQYHNSKLVFISAFVILEAGSLICGVAGNSITFILGRAISGAGGAGILNGGFLIIAEAAPLEVRPKLIGIMLGIASLGVAIGPLIGGALTQYASWRWCFYINLPLGVVTVLTLIFIRVPDAQLDARMKVSFRRKIERLDLPGSALFASVIVMLLMGLNWGGAIYAWDSSVVIGLMCGSAATFLIFLFWEHRQGEGAMLPLYFFRDVKISCAAASGIMSYGGLYVTIVYLPLWFQAVKGVSALRSGIYYLPSVGTTITFTIMSGFLVSLAGYYTPFMIIGGAIAAIAGGLFTTFKPTSPSASWVCYQLLNGVARGLMSQIPVTAIQANVSKEHISTATALVVFSQNFGASLFITLGQTVFQNSLVPALAMYAPEVNARQVVNAGATDFRALVPEASLVGVLDAFNKALTSTFYLAAGSSIAAFILAWGLGWTSVKKKTAETSGDREVDNRETDVGQEEFGIRLRERPDTTSENNI